VGTESVLLRPKKRQPSTEKITLCYEDEKFLFKIMFNDPTKKKLRKTVENSFRICMKVHESSFFSLMS
jgi:hypothetical protein